MTSIGGAGPCERGGGGGGCGCAAQLAGRRAHIHKSFVRCSSNVTGRPAPFSVRHCNQGSFPTLRPTAAGVVEKPAARSLVMAVQWASVVGSFRHHCKVTESLKAKAVTYNELYTVHCTV